MQSEDRQSLNDLSSMMQEFLQTLDMTSKQVDELILDKENRDKNYQFYGQSDYAKAYNEHLKKMQNYIFNKNN